jgi:hypothetical protein
MNSNGNSIINNLKLLASLTDFPKEGFADEIKEIQLFLDGLLS